MANITCRWNDTTYTFPCLVTWLAQRHPIVLGMDFLKENCPAGVALFATIGCNTTTTTTSPEDDLPYHPTDPAAEPLITNFLARAATTSATTADATTGGGDQIPPEYADFADVFSLDYEKNPPRPSHGAVCTITTTDNHLPPPRPPIPLNAKDRAEESRQLDNLLALGRVEPSASPTAAASFFVNKACRGCDQLRCTCGQKDYERRWVIDYRPINALTAQDAYPLPSIPELLSVAPGHRYYTKFDVDSAFHLVPVLPADRPKTAFVCSRGLFQWTVMPFGLKNAPATFQRMIDSVLLPARSTCRAFMDDGIIWADSRDDIVARTRQVFSLLRAAGLRAKLRKCAFNVPEVKYLGHVISASGVATDPSKLQGIRAALEPRTKRDIRGFLGLTGYYREFMPRYSEVALPLSDLTKDDAPAEHPDGLPPPAAAAFRRIRDYWSNPAHLATYRDEEPVSLYTDASTQAWGGVIEQRGRPLAFLSGKFDVTQRAWPTTDRELYPCLAAHQRFPHLLQGKDVTWFTDHQALKTLRTTLANSPRRIHWRETLDQFPFRVAYKRGREMHVDGMTRHSTWPQDTGDNEPVLDLERFRETEVSPAPPEGAQVNMMGAGLTWPRAERLPDSPPSCFVRPRRLLADFWENYVGSDAASRCDRTNRVWEQVRVRCGRAGLGYV